MVDTGLQATEMPKHVTGGGGDEPAQPTDLPSAEFPATEPRLGMVPPPPDGNCRATTASIHSGPANTIPESVVSAVQDLEKSLGMPVFLMIQNGGSENFGSIDSQLSEAIKRSKDLLVKGPLAIVVDSLGGNARNAYRIARTLRRRRGGFIAVIPNRAKSAATLLCLGADRILMANDGELGPIDVQIYDENAEGYISALDETQVLERLQAATLDAVDSAMFLFAHRLHKKTAALLPNAVRLVSDTMRPLYEGIDVVRYARMSRELKVGEEYAKRLLEATHSVSDARTIARRLVVDYPEHGFVIDFEESQRIGLQTKQLPSDDQLAIERLMEFGRENTVVGFLGRVSANVDSVNPKGESGG